jgi:uncharacterized membrane protein
MLIPERDVSKSSNIIYQISSWNFMEFHGSALFLKRESREAHDTRPPPSAPKNLPLRDRMIFIVTSCSLLLLISFHTVTLLLMLLYSFITLSNITLVNNLTASLKHVFLL